MASVVLKKSYKCVQSLQQFYTGGPYAVSSDESFLVCACGDTIKFVDLSNASIKSTVEGDSEPVTALVLSPSNNLLFSASHSRQIRVWDISTLKCLHSWKGHEGPLMGMACDASGGLLATAGADRKVLVWDVDGGSCTHYFKGHKGVVTTIMFHPDPNRLLLLSGGDDGSVGIWDLMRKKCLSTLEKHQSAITSMSISEDGWTLLSAGRDKLKGIAELLEGLVPYSQRHFNRVDRLAKSTFLLDYTLTRMSVIEPEGNEEKLKDKDAKLSTGADREQLAEIASMEQEQQHKEIKEQKSSKKQKNKSRDVDSKKVKGVTNTFESVVGSVASDVAILV